jgi:hypothetical protein
MNGLRVLAAVLALALAAGCASAPSEPPSPPAVNADPRVLALQQSLDAALAREPSTIRRRYAARVLGVEQKGADLLFELEVDRAAAFGREPRHFNLIAACGAGALDDCTRKALAAIRGAATID